MKLTFKKPKLTEPVTCQSQLSKCVERRLRQSDLATLHLSGVSQLLSRVIISFLIQLFYFQY